jgi:hypothetical protein
MSRLLAIAVAFCALGAFAAKPRISIVDFKGPKASAVRSQLEKKLCKTFKCVKPGSDDAVEVDAVVSGEIAAKQLTISVYYDEDQAPVTREIKLKAGKVAATGIKAATSAVREALATGVDAEDAANTLTGSP